MQEEWKNVVGYEGYYIVSNMGNIKRLVSDFCLKERNLKPHTDKLGYKRVALCVNSMPINKLVHRVVAICFIENIENKPHINHLDGNPSNNCYTNLEWCTHRENIQHAHDTGLATSDHTYKKVIRDDGKIYKSLTQAAVESNVTVGAIHYAIRHSGNCKLHQYNYL